MLDTSLSDQLDALRSWQRTQLRVLAQLRPWLRQQGLCVAEARHTIARATHALDDHRLTVAVAGEFSRGKTELLNALFFADLGCRLLPTDAGRTTMCPTEIFHDAARAPMLRLLPIETRSGEHSLARLRDGDDHWHEVALNPADPVSVATALQALTQQRAVPGAVAAELGLATAPCGDAGLTLIPRWRLAQVNIPHPLLDQGLRILDTPGLKAIGSEPELTYEMLPAAHAVIFVLGADTGVTQSDLEIWQRFIQHPRYNRRPGLMVVLNKSDTLWDDLRPVQQIAESICRQCQSVAETLGVGTTQVFAVSAQKALVARVQGNPDLERRSGIAALESHIAGTVMGDRMRLIQAEHTRLVVRAIDVLESVISGRLEQNAAQRRDLLDLAGRSDAAIRKMLTVTQNDYRRYQNNLETYRRRVDGFHRRTARLSNALDPATLDARLQELRQSMSGAWTTIGLRDAMRTLFDELNARIDVARREAQQMRRQLRRVHRHFELEHDLRLTPPPMFSIVHQQVELSLLDREAEQFRNSARTTLMEQRFVIRRYFDTIVTRASRIVADAHEDARQWADTVMAPLTAEIKTYRETLAQRIEDLRETAESRKTIQRRIVALRHDSTRLQAQLGALSRVRQTIASPEQGRAAEASGQN